MNVWDYFEDVIKQKDKSKSFIYRGLDIHATGLDYKIKKNAFSLEDYLKICKLLEIDPKGYFNNSKPYESNSIDNSIVREPETVYQTSIKKTETDLSKVIDQNTKLIAIIDRLTK